MQNPSLPEKDIQEEKSLHAQAEAFRLQESLLNAAGLGIIITTPEGVINTFNRTAENLLGYDVSEVIGKATPLIFHDPDELVKKADETSKASGKNIEPAFDVLITNAASQKIGD